MRDANGTGNLYFDDVFEEGLPYLSLVYWCLNGTFGLTNLLLTPVFFYLATIQQSYHKNLRIVASNLYLSFFLSSIGNSVYTLMVLARVSDKDYDNLFTMFRFIQNLGPNLWKSTFLAIILERAAATIFAKSYEHRAPLILGVFLYLFGMIGALLSVYYFLVRVHYAVILGANASLDIICWLSIFVLFWINKKLHKIKFDATIQLSYRYQITENLRFLQIITPLIIIECVINFAAMILYSIETAIDFNTLLYYPSTMLLTNIYVSIFYIFYFKNDERSKKKFFSFLCFKSTVIDPLHSQIRNVIGEQVMMKNNAEIHFMQLDKYWT